MVLKLNFLAFWKMYFAENVKPNAYCFAYSSKNAPFFPYKCLSKWALKKETTYYYLNTSHIILNWEKFSTKPV